MFCSGTWGVRNRPHVRGFFFNVLISFCVNFLFICHHVPICISKFTSARDKEMEMLGTFCMRDWDRTDMNQSRKTHFLYISSNHHFSEIDHILPSSFDWLYLLFVLLILFYSFSFLFCPCAVSFPEKKKKKSVELRLCSRCVSWLLCEAWVCGVARGWRVKAVLGGAAEWGGGFAMHWWPQPQPHLPSDTLTTPVQNSCQPHEVRVHLGTLVYVSCLACGLLFIFCWSNSVKRNAHYAILFFIIASGQYGGTSLLLLKICHNVLVKGKKLVLSHYFSLSHLVVFKLLVILMWRCLFQVNSVCSMWKWQQSGCCGCCGGLSQAAVRVPDYFCIVIQGVSQSRAKGLTYKPTQSKK